MSGIKQYDLPIDTKVILVDRKTLQYTTMFWQGMDGSYGKWKMSGMKFTGNLYGKFHWNESQKYYYYEFTEDE